MPIFGLSHFQLLSPSPLLSLSHCLSLCNYFCHIIKSLLFHLKTLIRKLKLISSIFCELNVEELNEDCTASYTCHINTHIAGELSALLIVSVLPVRLVCSGVFALMS